MTIKQALKLLIAEERPEPASKGYHLVGTYQRGKNTPAAPDYWEWGIK